MSADLPADAPIVARLEATIRQRLADRPAGSYVTELASGGHATMASKVIEEAYEFVEACADQDERGPGEVAHEAADLVFHLMVLLAASDTPWSHVEQELVRRFGIGGLTEKAQRPLP